MAEKRKSAPVTLSSRAHAFSVEALLGPRVKKQRTAQYGSSGENAPEDDVLENFSASDGPHEDRTPEQSSSALGSIQALQSRLAYPLPQPDGPADQVRVELQGKDLWARFHDIGTEMIITKAGRRMFPAIRTKVTGLDPKAQYIVIMDIVPVDNKRYRYVYHSSKWMCAGSADAPPPPRVYVHPDSPASGEAWMRQTVSFDKLKLTNNENDEQGYIILHSMHKYQPRVHIIKKTGHTDLTNKTSISPGDKAQTFSFPETVFTTVTAYQNQQITRLKIDRNPFAKGFRDSGRNRSGLECIMDSYALWHNPGRPLTYGQYTSIKTQEEEKLMSGILPPPSPPTAFYLAPNTFNVGCREGQTCMTPDRYHESSQRTSINKENVFSADLPSDSSRLVHPQCSATGSMCRHPLMSESPSLPHPDDYVRQTAPQPPSIPYQYLPSSPHFSQTTLSPTQHSPLLGAPYPSPRNCSAGSSPQSFLPISPSTASTSSCPTTSHLSPTFCTSATFPHPYFNNLQVLPTSALPTSGLPTSALPTSAPSSYSYLHGQYRLAVHRIPSPQASLV